ncbi:putative secreted protein (Por secretion system target) [Maribacter vaceletii]|uniref:Putative secreted protein (Por secretion system target) n=1 Tax=Maribacter vaceletii TaxID=1206816 RepID=A0A495ECN9_9FLAO|nr:T9SS type A sorting domain-containing protein [Maribacter vaceletii]RKR14648.1 putative secreted protein (Por secretion system target) [Maribacter vaceletii]
MKKKLLLLLLLTFWTKSNSQITLIEDLTPGAESSNPFEFLEHDGQLFFIGGSEATNNNVIYIMDSLENISIAWQEAGSNPYSMVVYNNELYFEASNKLHKLNLPYGTGSTIVDNNISIWGRGFVYNGELFFGGELNQIDPLNPNYELMAYNGTSTRLVKEESSISLNPGQFVIHLGELHFVGNEEATINGQPATVNFIYKTDGTTIDVVTFFQNTSVSYLRSLNDNLYFLYRNGDFNQPYNLWSSNTTATAGFGDEISFAFGLTVFDNKLYFFDVSNNILYSSEQLGVFVPVPIENGVEYPSGSFPIVSDNLMAFTGYTNTIGNELYMYEKNNEIKFTEDYNSGSGSFTPVYGSFFNDKLYITGDDGTGIGRELHVYDPNDCQNTIDIEDSNFENYLENVLNVGDGILGNKKVCKEKVEVLTTLNLSGTINMENNPPGLGVTNLSGIEAFRDLEILRIEGNTIANVDLRQNTNLKELRAWRNNMETLNIEDLTLLEIVGLDFNNLTTIDFSTNNALQILDINNNNLTSIIFSNNTNFNRFRISNNVNLSNLNISLIDSNLDVFVSTGNTSLSCIQVSSTSNAESQANWQKDVTTSYSLNCSPNTPFNVTTTIVGAGNTPNYTINEGETFTINFDADNTAANGTTYNPEITFSLNGISSSEDFLFNGSISIPNNPFTVSSNNPDGSITVQAITDNFLENDEVYTVNISSRNNTEYTIADPISFTITVKDVEPVEPFVVNTYLSLPVGQPNNTIEEGQKFRIYFEASTSQYYDNQSFDVFFNSDNSSALFNEDFTHENSPASFTARHQHDAVEFIEVEVLIDSQKNENEDIVIILQKDPSNKYKWGNEKSDGTLEFRINIEDISDVTSQPFIVQTSISENASLNTNGSYTVNEGETFTINLNALSPATDFYKYKIIYNTEGTTANADEYSLAIPNPLELTSQQSVNPDGELSFTINTDNIIDNEDKLIINFLNDPDNIYTWQGNNINPDGSLSYEIIINDIPPTTSDIITVKFNNTGGIEGGTDTFIVELFDSQGNPWTSHNGLEFSLDFKDEIFDTDIEYAINNNDINGEKAETDDYKNNDSNKTDITNPKISINPGESSGEFTVFYPQENEPNDDKRDYYSVEISSTNNNISFDNKKIQAVILDNAITAQFLINIYPGVNMSVIPTDNENNFDPGCCLEFSVEEGEQFIIYLDVEKGVPAGTNYDVEFNFQNSKAEEGTNKDFTHENVGSTIRGTVSNGNGPFDNRLIVNVNEDDIPNEHIDPSSGDNLIGEKLRIGFTSISSQFTIADRFFDQDNFQNEGDINKLSIRSSFALRIIDVIKIKEFIVSDNKNEAREDNLENAEFTIEMEAANTSGEDIRINYQILVNGVNNATPGQDYLIDDLDLNTLTGFVLIPDGSTTARIVVKPINDLKFENIENVVIQLIEGSRYSINSLTSKQITILSDDDAEYTAEIKSGIDNQSREEDIDDFAEVIIELNEIPITDIEVEFKISNLTDVTKVIEGQDYLIYQNDKTTLINSNSGKVLFNANVDKSKSIFIKALNDGINENLETLYLQLDSGVNYDIRETDNAQVVLISSTSDTSNFDPRNLTIIAKNPRCPGSNQKGSIEIANASPFVYNVTTTGLNGINYQETKVLNEINSNNFKQFFNQLPIGSYEVKLEFNLDINQTIPDNVILPNYIIKITELEGMSIQEQSTNLKTKTGNFIVSGSEKYTVESNGKTYQYQFKNTGKNVITVPLKNGLNSIIVSGEALCLGSIKKEILLNDVFIYPNPTKDLVSVFSNSLLGKYEFYLFDIHGRLVYHEENDNPNNNIEFDISNLHKGMYIGKIISKENKEIKFKLLKK